MQSLNIKSYTKRLKRKTMLFSERYVSTQTLFSVSTAGPAAGGVRSATGYDFQQNILRLLTGFWFASTDTHGQGAHVLEGGCSRPAAWGAGLGPCSQGPRPGHCPALAQLLFSGREGDLEHDGHSQQVHSTVLAQGGATDLQTNPVQRPSWVNLTEASWKQGQPLGQIRAGLWDLPWSWACPPRDRTNHEYDIPQCGAEASHVGTNASQRHPPSCPTSVLCTCHHAWPVHPGRLCWLIPPHG